MNTLTDKQLETVPTLKAKAKRIQELVASFNEMNSDGVIYLKRVGTVFRTFMRVSDPFLIKENYEAGIVPMHLSKDFYRVVCLIAEDLGFKLGWNNTRTSGWEA